MRRNSVFKRIQKESELAVSLLFCKAKCLEHHFLDIILEDSDTTTTNLISVQNDIVCFRTNSSRIRLDILDIFFHRHCKWVVHCNETILLLAPLKQRELCDPYKTILILIKKLKLFCKLNTECSKRIPYHFVLVSCKEKQISRLSIHSFYKCIHLLVCHEFCERRLHCSIFLKRNISQSLSAVIFNKRCQLVDLLSRHAALSFGIDTTNTSTILKRACKYCKSTVFHYIRYIFQFHSKTKIRLIRAITVHCFLPCHSLDWKLYIYIKNLFEKFLKILFIYFDNIIYVNERKLHIDLCEFRLSVRTKILITETSCDLDVTVYT